MGKHSPLLRVELLALAALALCALLYAATTIAFFIAPAGNLPRAEELPGQALLLSLYFFLFGFLPVALYGAPAYVELRRREWANWLSVLAVGAAPGLALLSVDAQLGIYAIATGCTIATLTHGWFRRGF